MGREHWTDAHLDAMREVADPLADELIDEVYALGQSDALNRHLRFGAPLPADLQVRLDAYLAASQVRPPWASETLIDVCEEFFDVHGMISSLILCCASLPECYLDRMDSPVLTSTRQLVEHTERRILETSEMVVNAMTEGDLMPGQPGSLAVQRVRLMHAAIRRLLKDNALRPSPQDKDLAGQGGRTLWPPAHGQPINQEAMAYVILTFSHVALRSLERLHVEATPIQRRAYLHTWSVVGYLMGVREELLVAKSFAELDTAEQDAAALFEKIKSRRCGESDHGKALTAAILDWMSRSVPFFLKPLPRELLILLMGRTAADQLGVPRAEGAMDRLWTALIHLVAVLVRPLMRFRIVKRLAQWLYHVLVKTEWRKVQQLSVTAFGLPPSLQQSWNPGPAAQPQRPA